MRGVEALGQHLDVDEHVGLLLLAKPVDDRLRVLARVVDVVRVDAALPELLGERLRVGSVSAANTIVGPYVSLYSL